MQPSSQWHSTVDPSAEGITAHKRVTSYERRLTGSRVSTTPDSWLFGGTPIQEYPLPLNY
jgi:hypothetical protein